MRHKHLMNMLLSVILTATILLSLFPLTMFAEGTAAFDDEDSIPPDNEGIIQESPEATQSSVEQVPMSAGSKQVRLIVTVKNAEGIASRGYTAADFSVKVDNVDKTFAEEPFSSFIDPDNGVYDVYFTGDADNTEYTLTDLTVSGVVIETEVTVTTPQASVISATIDSDTLTIMAEDESGGGDDTIPPEFKTGYPRAIELPEEKNGTRQVGIFVQAQEPVYYHLILLPDGAEQPTKERVRDGQDASGNPAICEVQSTTNKYESFEQITKAPLHSTEYDVFIVLSDDAGNLSEPEKVDVITPPAADFFAEGFPTKGTAQPEGSKEVQVIVRVEGTQDGGQVRYVLVPDGEDSKPTIEQISEGKAADGNPDMDSGAIDCDNGAEESFVVTELADETAYDLYMVAWDTFWSSHSCTEIVKLDIMLPAAPIVLTDTVTEITAIGALLSGNVTSEGGASVTDRGFVYGTSVNPTIAGSTKVTSGSGTGVFTAAISGLTSSTTYHVRAYATNSEGTTYGSDVSFTTANPGTDNIEAGDIVYFGRYPQTNLGRTSDMGAPGTPGVDYVIAEDQNDWGEDGIVPVNHYFKIEPIAWRVLSVEDDNLFLLSEEILDDVKYHEDRVDVTWKRSTVRSWLNGYSDTQNKAGISYSSNNFLFAAFSIEEQAAISVSSLTNPDNSQFPSSPGGDDTEDKIFLLSFSEAVTDTYGFRPLIEGQDELRAAPNTGYTTAKYNSISDWILRSPGETAEKAAQVDRYGSISMAGNYVNRRGDGIRPALRVQASAFSTDGTAPTVTGIAVKTQPMDLAYKAGEALDLTGLVVTLTYSDSSAEDVALVNFAAKNIAVNPANGTPLAVSYHNKPVVVSCGGQITSTNNLTVMADNTDRDHDKDRSSGRSSSDSTAPKSLPMAKVIDSNGNIRSTITPRLDGSTGTVSVAAGATALTGSFDKSQADENGLNTVEIHIPETSGAKAYASSLPSTFLTSGDALKAVKLKTPLASVTVPGNMLTAVNASGVQTVTLTIAAGDKSKLSADAQSQVGNRPILELSLKLDGKQASWSNENAPVTVSIPYTPTSQELANPESIVIWYIDGSGNVVSVPNGCYDPVSGTVTFTTTHFSSYAVGYNKTSFKDVAVSAWYSKAVSFVAARGIAIGTGGGNFSPEAKLTRGQFIVMMMNAYGIAPDADPKQNFSDAGNTYYTGYLAAAKRLGISAGVGNNRFAPENEITHQEMFTLLYNALKAIGKLPRVKSGKLLPDFVNISGIAPWAKDAMVLLVETGAIESSNEKLEPTDITNRAQMAQVLYKLLSK